jgi:hypothetical protein
VINYYQTLLAEQLKTQWRRVYTRPLKTDSHWDKLPQAVKPVRPSMERAVFASCKWRRRGYLITLTPRDFLTLAGGYALTKATRTLLKERLERGLAWAPLVLSLRSTEAPAQVSAPARSELEIASFLLERGQENIRVQVLHTDNEPANRVCLNYMREHGLVPLSGSGIVTLEKVEVTL